MIGSWFRTRSRAGVSTLVVAVYIMILAFVAASHHSLNHVSGARGIVTALAMLLWPLVLFGLYVQL